MGQFGKKLDELFVSHASFGHKIGVHYRNKESYQTRIGAVVTLLTYMLMLANGIQLFY